MLGKKKLLALLLIPMLIFGTSALAEIGTMAAGSIKTTDSNGNIVNGMHYQNATDVYISGENLPAGEYSVRVVLTSGNEVIGFPDTTVTVGTDGTFTPGVIRVWSYVTYDGANGWQNVGSRPCRVEVSLASSNFGSGTSKTDNFKINNWNSTPIATDDDGYWVYKNQVLTVGAPGVLANDTDADEDVLTAVLFSGPTNGSLTFNSNGSFVYTPNQDYIGQDIFTYKASDGVATSSPATVTISVRNQAPVGLPDTYNVAKDSVLNVDRINGVLNNDSDPDGDSISVQSNTTPENGVVSMDPNGSFTYTPTAGYVGTDTFTYVVTDGDDNSEAILVTINVTPLAYLPVKPVLEGKVIANSDGTATAWWGYDNLNEITVNSMVSKFTGNAVSGTINPPTTFQPGRNVRVFSTDFAGGGNLVWTLKGPDGSQRTATAGWPSHLITVTATEGGLAVGGGTKAHNSQVTVTATPDPGYRFLGWYEDSSKVHDDEEFNFTALASRSLEARFESEDQPHASLTISKSASHPTRERGQQVTYTITVTNNGTMDLYDIEVSDPMLWQQPQSLTLYSLQSHTYTVTYTVPSTQPIGPMPNTVTATAWPMVAYSFSLETLEIEPLAQASATATVTITQPYIPVYTYYTLNLSASPVDAGTVTGAGTYLAGSERSISATAKPGYTFVNWTEGSTILTTSANTSLRLNNDRTLVANFVPAQYTVTVAANPEAGGTATGGGTYDYNEEATVSAEAAEGYDFVEWTEGDNVVIAEADYGFKVTANRGLVAQFARKAYTVTLTSNPDGHDNLSGAGTYYHGDSATLLADTIKGYKFINWTENGQVLGNAATLTVVVTGDRDIVANYQPDLTDPIPQPPPELPKTGDVTPTLIYGLGLCLAGLATRYMKRR